MNKNRKIQKAITFFLVTVIMAVGLFITAPPIVEAASGSLYLVANHHTAQFDAWAINPGGTAEYQASYSLSHATDPAGIAIDESSKTLFVTSEFDTGVEMVDATTMTSLGVSSGPSDLAGIAVDDANDIIYAVERSSDNLYVFDWDPNARTLTPRAGFNPYHLPGCSGVFGIALDDIRGILWVADTMSGGSSNGDRDIFEVNGVAGPVDIEVISGDFDTILGLFDASGNLIATNDDGGSGTLSRFSAVSPEGGIVRFGITGYSDFSFTGGHSKLGSYQIAVWPSGSTIPTEPIENESEPNTLFAERNTFASAGELLIDGSMEQLPPLATFARAYDTSTWVEDTSKSFVPSHKPVDIAVDRVRSCVYTVSMASGAGGLSGGSHLLSKYDLLTGTETTTDIGTQGVAVDVDEVTGLVYVTLSPYDPGWSTGRLGVWDTFTAPWTKVQEVSVSGSPAGICIPQEEAVAYNPLGLSKHDGLSDGQCISAGEHITYEICFDNTENALDVHNVIIVDNLPVKTSFVSATTPRFVYPTNREPAPPIAYGYDGACTYYAGYAGWLASGDEGHYVPDKYHIGQDIPADGGDPVYAISNGEIVLVHYDPDGSKGWGQGNYGLFVKHELNTGEEFLALYGHVRPFEGESFAVEQQLTSGQPFAKIGPFSPPHLHFGIYPGEEAPGTHIDEDNPRNNIGWGRMGLNHWNDPPPANTNGFVDPINWITTQVPKSAAGVTYDPSAHTVSWDIGTLAAGAAQQCVQLVVNVESDAVPGSTLVNYITIDSDDTPPTTITEPSDICPVPDQIGLEVAVAPKPPANGKYYEIDEDIEFDVTVHNPTDFDAYQVKLTAVEPPEIDIEDGWFATPWPGKEKEDIPAGETRSTTFEAEAVQNGESIEVVVNAWGITDLYEAGNILGDGSCTISIHPEEGPDWSFAIITDLHIGYNSVPWDSDNDGYEEIDYAGKGWNDGEPLQEDSYDEVTKRSRYAVETIIAEKDYYNIKFVMVLGDVSDTAELSEFLTAREILNELNGAGIPYIPLFGNHDTWPYAQDKDNERDRYSSIANCAAGDQFFKEVFWGEANNENKFLIDNLFGGSWDHTYDEPVELEAGILECGCYDFTLQTDDGEYFEKDNNHMECNNQYLQDYYLQNYGFTYNGITFICLDQVPRLGEDREPWNGNALPGALKGLLATDHEQTVDFSREYYETYPSETAVLFSHYPTDWQSIDNYLLTPRQRLLSPSDGPEDAYWFAGHVHWQKDSGLSNRYAIASEDVAGIGLEFSGVEIPAEWLVGANRNGKTIRIVQIEDGELDYSTVLKPVREMAIKWPRPLLDIIWPWKSLPEPGTEITFTARCASYYGFSSSFDWDFGDSSNTSSLWPSATHSYSTEGDYDVTVTVTIKNITTGEETTQSTTRTLCVRSKHLISPLPSDLNAISFITEEDLTQVPKNTYQPALVAKQASEELPIGQLGVHFEDANADIDLSTLVADIDIREARSVLYMPSWPEEVEEYKNLYIPSTGVGTVYICLDADSLSEVGSENADVVMNVGETKDGMTVTTTFYNDREYYLVTGVTGTGGGEILEEAGGSCFIATAAYGTPMAEEIQILHDFRDEYLLTNPLGQAFVDFYYRISPPIAKFITEHPSLKPIVRAGLLPVVAMSAVIVNTTLMEKVAILCLLVLVSVAVSICVIRRRGRRPEYS